MVYYGIYCSIHTFTATTKRYSNMKVESATEVLRNIFDRFTE